MEMVKFNEEVFESLVRCGFRYCYSQTITDPEDTGRISILLTPIGFKPDIRKLPKQYDTFFKFHEEPKQMTAGIDSDTTVYVNLNDTLLKECYEQENSNY